MEDIEDRVRLQPLKHITHPVQVGGGGSGGGGGGGVRVGGVEVGAGFLQAPLHQLHLEGETTATLVEQGL